MVAELNSSGHELFELAGSTRRRGEWITSTRRFAITPAKVPDWVDEGLEAIEGLAPLIAAAKHIATAVDKGVVADRLGLALDPGTARI